MGFNKLQDEYLFAQIKAILSNEGLSEEMRHTLLALLVDLQTDYHQIQLGRDQWLFALDAMNAPVFILDSEFRVVRANMDYAKNAGMDIRDVIGKPYWQVFPLLEGPSENYRKYMREHNEVVEELSLPNGQLFLDHSYSVFDDEGCFAYSLHMLEDISKRLEREEKLKSSKDLIESIVEHAPIRVFWKDRGLRYLGCNTLFAKDAGLDSPDVLIGKTDFEMGWLDQAELYRADDMAVMDSGIAKLNYEEAQTTPDGKTIWLRTSKVPLRNSHQEVFGLLGIYDDITERKLAKQALGLSESRLKKAQQVAHLGSWELDLANSALWWSDETYRVFGVQPGTAVTLETFLDTVHPDDRTFIEKAYADSLENSTPFDIEHRLLMKDGSVKWVNERCETHYGEDGTPLRSTGTALDITERKRSELEAIEERNFSNALIASQPDLFFVLDSKGRYIRWNDKMNVVLGCTDAQLAEANALTFIHEADRGVAASKIQEAFERGAANTEARLLTKAGARNYVFNGRSTDTVKGRLLIGIGTDITERKHMEQELLDSELAYRTLAQNLPGIVYRVFVREGGRTNFFNAMPIQITGYAEDELRSGTICWIDPLILDEDRLGVTAEVKRATAEKRAFAVEYRLKHKDGGIRHVVEHGQPVPGTDGAPLYIDGVIFDITEKKQAAVELDLVKTLVDNSSDAIEVLDPVTTKLIYVNETECRELGYSREELLSMKIADIDAGFTADQLREIQARLLQTGEARFESVHRRKDDTAFPVEVSAKLVELDKPYMLSIVRDITERKHAEQALKKLNHTLLTLREVNRVMVHSEDEDALIQAVCHTLTELGGYCFTWVGYAEHDDRKGVRPAAWSGEHAAYLDENAFSWNDDELGRGPSGTAIRTTSAVVANDIAVAPEFAPWREQATKHNFGSCMALPLADDMGCFGVLVIYATERNAFDAEAQSLLLEMSADLAFGIASSRHRSRAAAHERQMSDLIEHNPDAILMLNTEGNIEFVNPAAEALLGMTAGQLQGTPLGLTVTPNETTEIELLSRNVDGVTQPRSAEIRMVSIGREERAKTLAFVHDITERKKAETLRTRMGRILEHSWNEIYVFDADTLQLTDVSVGAQHRLGYSLDELLQMTPVDIEPEFSLAQYRILLEPLRTGEEREIQFEAEQRCKDGTLYPVEVRLQLSSEEHPPVYIGIIQDISERKNYIAELEHKALYDSLTGLPNRALLYARLGQILKIAQREAVPLAILSVSILRFDDINDLLGHEQGDLILQKVSSHLLKVCRISDVVARLGDNEFVIILEKGTLESAQIVARKIQKSLELPVNVADLSLEIETAVGIAVYPDHGDDSTTLLQRADIAMRMARHDGLGIMVYDSEIDPLSLKRLQLHGELREAIENGGMTLFYQPKVDIKTGRIVGVEALARWPHPREGMIPPNDFIPMIEQSGLIQPFTYWALEEAIKVLRRWKDDGIELVVSVNLSARNLLDSELPGSIAALLYAYQVSANNLCLEITESAIMSQPERALTILNQLHETGATISIDDFGTGYSSLSYLKKLPVDELKIDQSFIFGLTRDSDDETIVHSTIELAHNLSLKTVGEGVENKGILNMLGVLNCDIAQGYHISRPLPLEELQEFLRDSPWGLNS